MSVFQAHNFRVQEYAMRYVRLLHKLRHLNQPPVVKFPLPSHIGELNFQLPILMRVFPLCGLDVKYYIDTTHDAQTDHVYLLLTFANNC